MSDDKARFYYRPTDDGCFVVGDNVPIRSELSPPFPAESGVMRPVYFDDEGHARLHAKFLNIKTDRIAELEAQLERATGDHNSAEIRCAQLRAEREALLAALYEIGWGMGRDDAERVDIAREAFTQAQDGVLDERPGTP